MTYNLVHRTHVRVFGGAYYPLPFANGYVDPWLQDVYKAWNASHCVADVHVTNRVTTANYGGGGGGVPPATRCGRGGWGAHDARAQVPLRGAGAAAVRRRGGPRPRGGGREAH
jgi:hypothetical protein